jgi:filamentous hemagglutinin
LNPNRHSGHRKQIDPKPSGSMGVGQANGNSASTTVAGITGFAGDKDVRTGDTSTALTPIFDKDKVKNDVNGQIAITATFEQLAPKAVGDYADKKLLEAINNTDQAGIDQWKEGGAARVALHVVVGGLSGGTAGALGAGTSQAIIPIIAEQIKATDLPEPLKQILIAVAGTAVGLAVAGPTGAATGFNATLNNFLKHDQADALRKDIEKCNAQGNACNQQAIVEKYKALSDANIAAVQSCILAGDPNCVTAIAKDAATVGEVAVFGFGGQTTIFEERAKLVTQERVATGPSSLISDVGAAKQMATVRTQVCGSMSATACDTKILELKGDEQVKALKLFAGALAGLPVLGVLVKAAPTLAVAAQMTVAACRASPVLCANEAGILISDILGAEALGGTTLAVGGTAKAVSKLEQKIADLKNAEATTANTAIKTESKACTTGTACFVAGTLVQTASGLKAIETLRDGEMVLSRHEDTQEIGYRPVVATKATHDQVLLEVVVENGRGETEMLHTTSEHPFWVADLGWHKASLLEAGMTLVDQDGNPITVQSQTALVATATVYNIQVEEHHTYHVGTFGVWVHNANCCDVVAQIPVSPTASGSINKTKLNGGAITLDINQTTQKDMIGNITLYGDQTGQKTEYLVNDVLHMDANVTILSGTKYGNDNGLDHVVQFVDPATNKVMTMIIDSKQLAENGTTSLDPKAAGGVMQLSDASLLSVMDKLGTASPAVVAIKQAQKEGTLVKAIAYVDKGTGQLKIVPVKP